MNHSYIKARYKALSCSNCETVFYLGMVFYKAPMGPRFIPRDTLMLEGCFPSRRLINRCYCESCGVEINAAVTKTMIEYDHDKALSKP